MCFSYGMQRLLPQKGKSENDLKSREMRRIW